MDGMIQEQAAMIAYDYVFLAIGILFLFCLPLIIFLRMPKRGVHSEMAQAE